MGWELISNSKQIDKAIRELIELTEAVEDDLVWIA